jgi:hypothetical protein
MLYQFVYQVTDHFSTNQTYRLAQVTSKEHSTDHKRHFDLWEKDSEANPHKPA